MDLIRKIPKKVTKKFVKKVINRQCFHRKTGLKSTRFKKLCIYYDTTYMAVL